MDVSIVKRKVIVLFSILGASIALGGCDVDPAVAPTLAPLDSLFWTLRINHPAVLLSLRVPYDTVRLSAAPYSATGTMIDTMAVASGDVMWYSTDSTMVRVTEAGVVSARGVTDSRIVYIIAKRQVAGITRVDSSLIQVVDIVDPPILASFRARPADSLKRAKGSFLMLMPQWKDKDSVSLSGYPVHYRSENPIVATVIDSWGSFILAGSPFQSNTIGTARITASTMAFGVSIVDTFTLEVGHSIDPPVTIPMVDVRMMNGVPTYYLVFPTVDLGPGGVASFTNNTGVTAERSESGLTPSNGTIISYIFDDSLNVKAAVDPQYTPTADGNIPAISGDTLTGSRDKRHFRRFPIPGRYEYTVQPFGLRGVVIVHER